MAHARYPWAEWTDGNVWALELPVVPPHPKAQTVKSVKTLMRMHAHRKGLRVRFEEQVVPGTGALGDGAPDPAKFTRMLRFQFKPRGEEDGFVIEDQRTKAARDTFVPIRVCAAHNAPASLDGRCDRCREGHSETS